MMLTIDQASPDPIYQQIRDQVVAAVARGELRPGDGLPSVRSLAADLGVNLHTVNKAYAVLRDEGHIMMRGRSGAFVADYAQYASPERLASADARLEESLRQLALEHKARGGYQTGFVALASKAAVEADAPAFARASANAGAPGAPAPGAPAPGAPGAPGAQAASESPAPDRPRS